MIENITIKNLSFELSNQSNDSKLILQSVVYLVLARMFFVIRSLAHSRSVHTTFIAPPSAQTNPIKPQPLPSSITYRINK